MTRERGTTRRALPWIVLAVMATAIVVLWRAARAPDADALAPGAAEVTDAPVVADEGLPSRVAAPPREAQAPARSKKSRSRSRSGQAPAEASARRLTGRTVDEQRQPLAGVRVTFTWVLGQRRSGEQVVAREARSDARGRFELEPFEGASGELHVSAWRDELDLLEASPVERDASGGWAPVELVLVPPGSIGLRVIGAGGEPIEGLEVYARAAPTEAHSLRAGLAILRPRHLARSARTDADGRVQMRVSARRLLELRLHDEDWDFTSDRVRDGELTRGSRGEPLVLEPGARLELVARLGSSLVIEGSVVRADGKPVDDGRIRLFDGDPALVGFMDARAELELDDQGRFRFELHDLDPDARLALLAVDGFWWNWSGSEQRGVVWRALQLEDALDGVISLALVVQPLLELQGWVLGNEGAGLSGTIWAIPAGSEYLLQKGPHGLLPLTGLRGDSGGEFTIAGLLPGEYDIIVKRNDPRTYHRFDGYTAGERGLELRIQEDRVVAIRMSFAGAEEGLRNQPVLLTHHFRRPSEHPPVPTAPRVCVSDCDLARWPTHERSWSVEGPEGRTISLVGEKQRATEHRFEPQQVGWYSVGARAWDAGGRPYLRRLSEPVWLERGEHEFVVELTPTTQLVGLALPGEHVEVLDAAGRRVPCAVDEPFAQADGRGAFRFDEVPVGALRVRAGSLAELERGRARMELAAHARRGEVLRLGFE